MKYEVTFEATGFTDDGEILDKEFSEQESIGFTEVAQQEGTLPEGVLAVKRGYISSDDGQGCSDIHVFVGVILVVEANSEEEANRFTPPEDLLTLVADSMGTVNGECLLELEAHTWEVAEEETSAHEVLDGASGQDRDSYSDNQDRKSYTC